MAELPVTDDSRRRMGIAAKLFFAILAVCAIMALGMGLATRISFQAGFLDYLGEIEEERLTAFATELGEDYSQNHNWEYLRNDPKSWRRLVGHFIRQEPAQPRKPDKQKSGNRTAQAPRTEDLSAVADRARRGWETAHLRSSLGLVEADKTTLVAGAKPGEKAFWLPVLSDGKTVGWLTREPFTSITDTIDVRFQEQQRKSIVVIAGLCLLLAAVVSVLMAHTLIAPLRRLAEVTNRLAAGDLDARASVETRDELHTLAGHLNQLADTLQRNESARRTFMAEISHDLRTPLAILRGEVEAMEDGVRPVTPAALASLKAEVNVLARLVDDIHTLSLADLGILSYQKSLMDLVPCLQAALVGSADRMATRSLELQPTLPDVPVMVLADAGRITQILHNVLENSLRYTYPGGTVQVRCHTEGSTVFVDVLDSPPAVPEEELSRLFERFRTGDAARNRSTSGSGLGLAICRTLAEAHGGSIRALPSPLGGIWIRITLPVAEDTGK